MLEQVAPLQAEMTALLQKSAGAREQLARYESDLKELDIKVCAFVCGWVVCVCVYVGCM